jgi:Spy/CpxP family protein refolding chaperone
LYSSNREEKGNIPMKTRVLSLILGSLVLSSVGMMGLASAKNCCKTKKGNGSTMSCVKPQPPAYGHGMGGFGMDKVAADWKASLALTPRQAAAFDDLEKQYKTEVTPLEEKSKASKLTMLEYLGCPSFNQEKVNALIDEYTAQKNTVLKARMDYYFHVQQLLTPEQLEKSRAFWAGHIQLMPYTPPVTPPAQ